MKKWLKNIWLWIDDRSGISEAIKPLMNHLVPPGAKWSYVFGSATLFCFLLQVVTGVGLALLYQPSSSQAYASLEFITHQATLGRVLRGIHYFGASGMILMAGIHMLRVYLTASYKYPREMSWISGVFLLLFVTVMGFTGQLLRWDDNGVWSAVVAAEQMGRIPLIGKFVARLLIGGDTIGGQTLSRFFAYHVFIFPALIFIFLGYHLFLVIRNGISEPPKAGRLVNPETYRSWYQNMLRERGVPFWPYAAWRDVVFGVTVLVVIVLLAIVIGPPALGRQPDPSLIYTAPKPDWYLLWLYALFALMPPAIESYVMFFGPLLAVGFMFSIPFLSRGGERSPLRRPWAMVGVALTVIIISSLLVAGYKSNWSPHFDTKKLNAKDVPSNDPLVLAGSVLFYEKGCLFCHRINDKGGLRGPDLSHVARRLNEHDMKVRIINGSENMPAYGQSLKKEELEKLIAFLKSRQ